MNLEQKYKEEIAKYLECDSKQIFLYNKGRVALYALLKAMNVGEGNEVIIPAYTCVVVANAIKYLKAVPVYVDIKIDSFTIDIDKIEAKINSKTKAIIAQNSFGLSANLFEIDLIAKKYNIFLIEDCTHGFGGKYKGKPNGTIGDASFFSTQWNKPFSTGIGGFSKINNKSLLLRIENINKELVSPKKKDIILLPFLYFAREKIMNTNSFWLMVRFYRWLSKVNIVTGSSSKIEINSSSMPLNFFSSLSNVQIKKGLKTIKGVSKSSVIMKENAIIYSDFLKSKNKSTVPDLFFDDHLFLYYPLKIKNKKKVILLAEKEKIPINEWFASPLHPVEEHFEKWDMEINNFPVAVEASKSYINLPTCNVDITKVINFLIKIESYIL